MIYSFEDENDELGMGFAEVVFDIDFTPHAGCGPSWSDWSGGDPGYDPYIEINGFSVVSVNPENSQNIKFADLDADSQKKVMNWLDCKMDDKFTNTLWDYVE